VQGDIILVLAACLYFDTKMGDQCRVSNTPGNSGNLQEIFFLLEILEIF